MLNGYIKHTNKKDFLLGHCTDDKYNEHCTLPSVHGPSSPVQLPTDETTVHCRLTINVQTAQ